MELNLSIRPNNSVIRRLVGLISAAATLEAEKEAAMNQAKSASRAAETLMDSGNGDSKVVKELEAKLKEKEDGASLPSSKRAHKQNLIKSLILFRLEKGQERCGVDENPSRKLGG